MTKRNTVYHIIYAFMALFFIGMIAWAASESSLTSPASALSGIQASVPFDTGWTLEDGRTADVAHLNKIPSVKPYVETSVYHTLPQDLGQGLSLCFRTKNIFYQVYVDGELRYSPQAAESPVYNESLGTRWNFVPLYSDDAGKPLEVRFHTVYEGSKACMDHLYLGSALGEILRIFAQKAVAFVTCLLLLFAGLLLIIADIPVNMQKQKNHELMYLGLFSVSVALWCLAETNLLQFFTDNSRILQTVSCTSLIMIPIPIVLYLDAAFGFKRRITTPVVCIMSGAEFLICTILHFTGRMDYHDTLTLSHIMLGISAVLLLTTILKNYFHMGDGRARNVYRVLRAIGLMGIGFATVIDIVRFYQGNNGDSAMFVRMGLLIFILCYGSSSLEKAVNAVKLGVQYSFVSQLAYRDGLTGIGNRTAFQERLAELEKEKDSLAGIGIIMFDVNDLKYVNDNLGHQKGDDMLVCSAELIKNALSAQGSCYRIGGDEFAVILSGENVSERCDAGLSKFISSIKEYNRVPGQPFRISIASGYAIYEPSENNNATLMDIYQQADGHMYENKKEIKSRQVGPEVYYAGR